MTSKPNTMGFSPSTIVVVKDKVASDVARAMIESGDQKEPFYIFDFDVAYDCVENFKEKMPRVQIFYAMKSNDHPMMLKLAIALGLGFDCASPGEIYKASVLNIPPTSIIYAVTMKTPEQMTFARQSGVRHTTFDSMGELKRLKQYWPDSKLLIRVKVESDSVYKLGDKFGCDETEALTLLDEARRLDMEVVGVAFHVGSACLSVQSYEVGLQTARTLFDYEAKAGRKMNILDIGGGFFVNNSANFSQVANVVNSGLAKWFPDENVQIIAEPGRYICESAFTLYTNIRDVRKITNLGKETKMVYLSSGINGTLKYVEKWHNMNILKKMNDGLGDDITEDTILWGPTIDDSDFLGPMMLSQTNVKDWYVFHDQGSYSLVFKSEYCGVDRTYTRSVVSEELWMALKEKPVFYSNNYIMDPNLPPILPSTLPPVLTNKITKESIAYCGEGFKTHSSPTFVLEKTSLNEVARAIIVSEEQKQPFYVFKIDEANQRVRHFHEMMPRIKVFYGMKSNDIDCMLRIAAASELGFSCASPEHIFKVSTLGVNPNNIIYAMPCKTSEEMEYARKVGVTITTFDNFYELKKIKRTWPDASLLLRVKTDEIPKNKIAAQFGCDFVLEATDLLDEAAILGLNVVGITFHVDSGTLPQSYVTGLRQARMLFDYEARHGRTMSIVDIGGGFLSDRTNQIDEVSYLINNALEDLFPDPAVEIIAEPGRYLCDSAFTLYCNIIGVRQGNLDDRCNDPVNMIYLNDGVHGTMRLDDDPTKLKKFRLSSETEPTLDQPCVLWGPTGDSIDRIMEHNDIKLPPCSANDWLVLDNHGAYTFSHSTRFSTLDIPSVRPIISKDLWKTIRSSRFYQPLDFVLNPDISEPLPLVFPPVLLIPVSSICADVVTLKL